MEIRKVGMTDHEFAAELRNRNVIDNYTNAWNMTLWLDKGVVVACILYDYDSPGRMEHEKYLVD